MPTLVDCLTCKGSGEIPIPGLTDRETGYPETVKCGSCDGEGIVEPPEEEPYWPQEDADGPDYLSIAKEHAEAEF